MKNFKQLEIWKKGFEISIMTYRLVAEFPKAEMYGLVSQITSAAVSIPSNIAEGSSRKSEKEKNRFLEHSLGSSFEMETQLLISQALKFGNAQLLAKILDELDQEQKMIMAFQARLQF